MTALWLFIVCAQLGMVAIGGMITVLPELQRQVTAVHGWLSPAEFGALYALAQAAPGPNVLVVTVVGWRVAGAAGAAAATAGALLPSGLLTWFVAGLWHRFRDRPWRGQIQRGLVPVTVGLVAAAAWLLTASTTTGWVSGAFTVGVGLLALRTRVHPLVLLGAGAGLGAAGLL